MQKYYCRKVFNFTFSIDQNRVYYYQE